MKDDILYPDGFHVAYTAKEIALILTPWQGSRKPRLIDAKPAIERIHHWTREGLLEPLGEKNPGRGRIRVYSDDVVYIARALNELADFGVGVAIMRAALPHIKKARGVEDSEGMVDFLCIQHGRAIGGMSIYLDSQEGGPVHVDFGDKREKILWSCRPEFHPLATSALFINLTQLVTLAKHTNKLS
jgi:DNA-binding transcriptional MerR regulator